MGAAAWRLAFIALLAYTHWLILSIDKLSHGGNLQPAERRGVRQPAGSLAALALCAAMNRSSWEQSYSAPC